jgi:hypothetical protein
MSASLGACTPAPRSFLAFDYGAKRVGGGVRQHR